MAVRHQLGELIETVMAANEWSLDRVVANAADRGFRLSRSNVKRLKDEPVKRIPADTMQALAAGLHVSPQMVSRAAIQAAGMDVTLPPFVTPEEAVQADALLTARDKQTVLALLATLRRSTVTSSDG